LEKAKKDAKKWQLLALSNDKKNGIKTNLDAELAKE
jgi:hypothetical protein